MTHQSKKDKSLFYKHTQIILFKVNWLITFSGKRRGKKKKGALKDTFEYFL